MIIAERVLFCFVSHSKVAHTHNKPRLPSVAGRDSWLPVLACLGVSSELKGTLQSDSFKAVDQILPRRGQTDPPEREEQT